MGMPPTDNMPAIFQFADASRSEDSNAALSPLPASGAEHCAAAPPFDPMQLQFHGPEPVTEDSCPAAQRALMGAAPVATPSGGAQWPLRRGCRCGHWAA